MVNTDVLDLIRAERARSASAKLAEAKVSSRKRQEDAYWKGLGQGVFGTILVITVIYLAVKMANEPSEQEQRASAPYVAER